MVPLSQLVLIDDNTEELKVYSGWRIMPALFAQFLKNIRRDEGIGYMDEYTFYQLFERAKQLAREASKEYEPYATIEDIVVGQVFFEHDKLKARLVFTNILGNSYQVEMVIT